MSFYWDWVQAFSTATLVIEHEQVAVIINWISFVVCGFLIMQQITALIAKPPRE